MSVTCRECVAALDDIVWLRLDWLGPLIRRVAAKGGHFHLWS